jgi:hypothetical protein
MCFERQLYFAGKLSLPVTAWVSGGVVSLPLELIGWTPAASVRNLGSSSVVATQGLKCISCVSLLSADLLLQG